MKIRESRLAVRRRQCEERRRYLGELETLARRLRSDGGRLRTEIEGAVARGDPRSAQPLLQRHGQLARSLAAIESQIAAADNALATAMRELQRHEATAAQRAPGTGASRRRVPFR